MVNYVIHVLVLLLQLLLQHIFLSPYILIWVVSIWHLEIAEGENTFTGIYLLNMENNSPFAITFSFFLSFDFVKCRVKLIRLQSISLCNKKEITQAYRQQKKQINTTQQTKTLQTTANMWRKAFLLFDFYFFLFFLLFFLFFNRIWRRSKYLKNSIWNVHECTHKLWKCTLFLPKLGSQAGRQVGG